MLEKISEEAQFWGTLDREYPAAATALRAMVARMRERGFTVEEIRADLERRIFGESMLKAAPQPAPESPPETEKPEPPAAMDAEMKARVVRYLCDRIEPDGTVPLSLVRPEELGIDPGLLRQAIDWNLGESVRADGQSLHVAEGLRRRVIAWGRWSVAAASAGDAAGRTFVGVPEGGEFFFWEVGASDCWADLARFDASRELSAIADDLLVGGADAVLIYGDALESLWPPPEESDIPLTRKIADFCLGQMRTMLDGRRGSSAKMYGPEGLLTRAKSAFPEAQLDLGKLTDILRSNYPEEISVKKERVYLVKKRKK